MNPKNKIMFGGLILVLSSVILLGAGCSKNSSAPGAASALSALSATDEKCIEFVAHTTWMAMLAQRQDMAAGQAVQQKLDNLRKQYGWDNDEGLENICQAASEKADFSNRLWKRMQELGFVIK
ncbi:MAG: hypothetical protein Q8L21_00770 [Candidatus Komeilibacteria bacterium]|nr:hypothetical protein [Candidatus Komeilibacteria bacterium]